MSITLNESQISLFERTTKFLDEKDVVVMDLIPGTGRINFLYFFIVKYTNVLVIFPSKKDEYSFKDFLKNSTGLDRSTIKILTLTEIKDIKHDADLVIVFNNGSHTINLGRKTLYIK